MHLQMLVALALDFVELPQPIHRTQILCEWDELELLEVYWLMVKIHRLRHQWMVETVGTDPSLSTAYAVLSNGSGTETDHRKM
jgi:hypothetical protein